MNAKDLELKISGLEKAIKEHDDASVTFQNDLKSTQKQLEDINNTEGISTKKLKDYHNFFKSIEKEMEDKDISLGKKIGWDTGKDSVFRKFITNNVFLPKTSIYLKKGS
mgnify:CR=1 FL=1